MNIAFRVFPVILSLVLLASSVALPFSVSAQMTQPGDISEPWIYSPSASLENPDDINIDSIYPKKGNPKLDSALNDMLSSTCSSFSASAEGNQSPMAEPSVRVVVESIPGCENDMAEASSIAGIVEAEYNGLLQVSLPLSSLSNLADNTSVRFIRQP
jgi:hypothetical protein